MKKWMLFLLSMSCNLISMDSCKPRIVTVNGYRCISPLQFKELSEEEMQNTTVVHQFGCATIRQPGKELVLLTPLCPCIGIVVRNDVTNITWCGHIHYANSVTDGVEKAKKAIGYDENNKDAITVFMFSHKLAEAEYNKGPVRWHRGKSQEEQIDFVQKTWMQGLDIDQKQISAYLFKPGIHNENIGLYNIDRSILTDGTTDSKGRLHLYSTSTLYFNCYSCIIRDSYTFTRNAYGRIRMSPHIPFLNIWHQYNTVPFAEVPKNNGATLINMQPVKNDPYIALFNMRTPFNMAVRAGSNVILGAILAAALVKIYDSIK